MTVSLLLAEIRSRGAVLSLVNGGLRVTAPAGAIDDAIKAELAQHKAELVRILSGACDTTEVLIEAHGVELVITADGRTSSGRAALSHREAKILTDASAGEPLTADMVHAIASVKRVFPESSIESAAAHGRGKESARA